MFSRSGTTARIPAASTDGKMPPFLVLKPDYPHESATNSLFSVKKGEIIECPPGFSPSSSFQVCATRAAAEEYARLAYLKPKSESPPPQPTQPPAEGAGRSVSSPPPAYPLFRKVASPAGEPVSYQLFSRDIHRFLSRSESEIIADIQAINLHPNTAERLLAYEQKHFRRDSIITLLKPLVPQSEEPSKEPVKEPVKEPEKKSGITTTKSIRGRLYP